MLRLTSAFFVAAALVLSTETSEAGSFTFLNQIHHDGRTFFEAQYRRGPGEVDPSICMTADGASSIRFYYRGDLLRGVLPARPRGREQRRT